jgi:AAA+ ATPase superfamily predicted ATPase
MITKFVNRKDEFQYLIDADRTIVSVFQRIWDLYLNGSNVFKGRVHIRIQ